MDTIQLSKAWAKLSALTNTARTTEATSPATRVTLHRAARTPIDRAASEHERSEEHTSELQSRFDLVCRLLLEKKKKNNDNTPHAIHITHHKYTPDHKTPQIPQNQTPQYKFDSTQCLSPVQQHYHHKSHSSSTL